ncbi:MAG: NnrU family protein [Lysobacterales bacterium]|nr:NnrU family protein [Xanthomonadales bacterium]MCP5475568.1 NnrU family protein [Rhodanobacteraceae bacterium]
MNLLFVGLLIFLGVHSISIVAPGWRERMLRRLGEKGWKGLYSLISIAGFALILIGYSAARQSPQLVYSPPLWTRHLAALLLLPVFPLLIATYFPGRIRRAVGHPMLIATVLWAGAHLLGTTTRADLLLFGSFLGWALADWASARTRPARALPGAPPSAWNDAIAVVLGIGVYLLMALWAHRWLIGIAPFG